MKTNELRKNKKAEIVNGNGNHNTIYKLDGK